MGSFQLKEGWGGFFDISGIVDGSYEVTPFAGESDVKGVNGTLGFDYNFAEDQAFFGGALSYQTGKAELGGPLQTVEANSFGINAYGGVREGNSFLTAYLGFSAQAYDLTRVVPLMMGTQTLTAAPDGHTWIAGAKMGFDIDVGNGTLTPHVGIDGMWIAIDGYTEIGGSAAMIAPDRTTTLLDGRVGVTYKGLYDVGGRRLAASEADGRLRHRRAERRQCRDDFVPRLPVGADDVRRRRARQWLGRVRGRP